MRTDVAATTVSTTTMIVARIKTRTKMETVKMEIRMILTAVRWGGRCEKIAAVVWPNTVVVLLDASLTMAHR